MQLFIGFKHNPDGTISSKETTANDRFQAAKKMNLPVEWVQLQTRKH